MHKSRYQMQRNLFILSLPLHCDGKETLDMGLGHLPPECIYNHIGPKDVITWYVMFVTRYVCVLGLGNSVDHADYSM